MPHSPWGRGLRGFPTHGTLAPAAAREEIRRGAHRAVERLADFKPYRLHGEPVRDLTFKNYMPAQVLAYLSVVERPETRTIRYRAEDMVEMAKFFQFVGNYEPGLSP